MSEEVTGKQSSSKESRRQHEEQTKVTRTSTPSPWRCLCGPHTAEKEERQGGKCQKPNGSGRLTALLLENSRVFTELNSIALFPWKNPFVLPLVLRTKSWSSHCPAPYYLEEAAASLRQ